MGNTNLSQSLDPGKLLLCENWCDWLSANSERVGGIRPLPAESVQFRGTSLGLLL